MNDCNCFGQNKKFKVQKSQSETNNQIKVERFSLDYNPIQINESIYNIEKEGAQERFAMNQSKDVLETKSQRDIIFQSGQNDSKQQVNSNLVSQTMGAHDVNDQLINQHQNMASHKVEDGETNELNGQNIYQRPNTKNIITSAMRTRLREKTLNNMSSTLSVINSSKEINIEVNKAKLEDGNNLNSVRIDSDSNFLVGKQEKELGKTLSAVSTSNQQEDLMQSRKKRLDFGNSFKHSQKKSSFVVSNSNKIYPELQIRSTSQEKIRMPYLSQFSPHTNPFDEGGNNSSKNVPEIKIFGHSKSQQLIQEQSESVSKEPNQQKGFFSFLRQKLGLSHPNSSLSNVQKEKNQTGSNPLISQFHSNFQSGTMLLGVNSQSNNQLLDKQTSPTYGQGSNGIFTPQEINPGTNWNFVKKLAKVKKFIDAIKTSNLYQSFYKVKNSHLQLISDMSDFTLIPIDPSQKKKKGKIGIHLMYIINNITNSMACEFISSIMEELPLFLPHQPMFNWFKVVMLIISLITLVFVPLMGSFQLTVDLWSVSFFIFFVIPFILFTLEILVSLNTAYYEEGDIQINRKMIITQYAKSNLSIDLISTVACYFLFMDQNYVFAPFAMFRLLKITAYRREINEYFYIQQRSNTIYTLVNLIFSVVFVAHYFACGFNYVAVIEEDSQRMSWIIMLNIDQFNWVSRYINSIYFSFITMVTVGFGDIKPMTDPEKIYVTLVALISSLIFAYTVNTIGSVFQEIAQQEAEYKSQKYHLSIYMRARQINQRLQTRTMKYLDHMIHKQLESPQKGQEILKRMSKKIRDDIYKDFFGKILLDSKMFKFNFSDQFLKELTVQMKEIICRPGEIIYSLNEMDTRIFFINKGEIELFLDKSSKKYEQDSYTYDNLTKGDIFGESSFFTSKLRETGAKSLSVSHLVFCTYEDFVSVLAQFPKDYEKFCQMKDEVMNYGEQLNTRCAVCQKFRHSIVDCPYIHLKKRHENVIHKHIRSIPNERSKHFRKKQGKINTLEINMKVRSSLRILRKECINKCSKKNKDDSRVMIDDTKAGYQINVKKQIDSDNDSIDTAINVTKEELRRISDKKFFLSTPKIYLDSQFQLNIQDEEDEIQEEVYDEDGDEYQNDDEYNELSDEVQSDETDNEVYEGIEEEDEYKEDQDGSEYHIQEENIVELSEDQKSEAEDNNTKSDELDEERYLNTYGGEQQLRSVQSEEVIESTNDHNQMPSQEQRQMPGVQIERQQDMLQKGLLSSTNIEEHQKEEDQSQERILSIVNIKQLEENYENEMSESERRQLIDESLTIQNRNDLTKTPSATSIQEAGADIPLNCPYYKGENKLVFKNSVFQLNINDLKTQKKRKMNNNSNLGQNLKDKSTAISQDQNEGIVAPSKIKKIRNKLKFRHSQTLNPNNSNFPPNQSQRKSLKSDFKKLKPKKQNDSVIEEDNQDVSFHSSRCNSSGSQSKKIQEAKLNRFDIPIRPIDFEPSSILKRKQTLISCQGGTLSDLNSSPSFSPRPLPSETLKFGLQPQNEYDVFQQQKRLLERKNKFYATVIQPQNSNSIRFTLKNDGQSLTSIPAESNEVRDKKLKRRNTRNYEANLNQGQVSPLQTQIPINRNSLSGNSNILSTFNNNFPYLRKSSNFKPILDFSSAWQQSQSQLSPSLHKQLSPPQQMQQLNGSHTQVVSHGYFQQNDAKPPGNQQINIPNATPNGNNHNFARSLTISQPQQNSYSIPSNLSNNLSKNIYNNNNNSGNNFNGSNRIFPPQIPSKQCLSSQSIQSQQQQVSHPQPQLSQYQQQAQQISSQSLYVQQNLQINGANGNNPNIPPNLGLNNDNNDLQEHNLPLSSCYLDHKMLFLYDFDKLKEYTNYFPHNNYTVVCKEKKKLVNRKNYFQKKIMLMKQSSRNLGLKLPLAMHLTPRMSSHQSFRIVQQGVLNNIALAKIGQSPASNTNINNKLGNDLNPYKETFNNVANDVAMIQSMHERGSKNRLKRTTESLINHNLTSARRNSKSSFQMLQLSSCGQSPTNRNSEKEIIISSPVHSSIEKQGIITNIVSIN